MFKEYLTVSYASSFWKGRVALYAILKAMGIGEGDEVLVEGFTCVVVPNAVIFTGAKPEGHIYLRYPLLVKDKNAILKAAQFQNIEIGDWFVSVLHPLNAPLDTACYRDGDCPVGKEIARHLINLPTHLNMNEEKVLKIVNFLKKMRDK